MPIYEIHCKNCDHTFESIQKVDDPLPKCVKCGKKKTEKLIGVPSIQFRGTGWTPKHYGKG